MSNTKPERPEWAYDGAEIYSARGVWNGPDHVKPCTVLRATPTQIIVKEYGQEARYRISDLMRVGETGRTGSRLVSSDDEVVTLSKLRAQTREAMRDLSNLVTESQKHARIFTDDPELALEMANAFRDAADKAVAGLDQARRDYPQHF